MRSTIILSLAIIIIWGSCNVKKDTADSNSAIFEKAKAFHYYDKLDSAFYLYNEYVQNTTDVLKKATAYRYMADILWSIGDVHGAEETVTGAIDILDSSDTAHYTELSYVYNLLGNVRLELQQYDDAITMFDNAKRFCTASNFVLEILNNKALAFQKKGDYNKAIAVYDSTLLLAQSNVSAFARILHNRARTKWLQNPNYPALPEYREALQIRLDSQYSRGLNASYAHLSDYYEKINPDSALWYAKKMLQQAFIIESPADRIEALDKIIRLDDPSELKSSYIEYKRLDDSLGLSRDTTQKVNALIRYDFQKNKEENIELKGRVARQWLLLLTLGLLTIFTIVWLWGRYNRRRKRIKLEAEKAIQQSKLKTSQKVHDVVANGLYVIMNELEHGKMIEKNELITRIEGLYEKSRNISYDETDTEDNPDHDKEIHQLFNDFSAGQTNVYAIGNQPAFWGKVTPVQKKELLLVLKELLVNMKKHSGATNVSVVFRQEDNKGFITYKDDGIGFPPNVEFGNGLKNTVNRIKLLNGEVIFGKSEKNGASVAISFPLEPNEL